MTRQRWGELPPAVRTAVADQVGPVHQAVDIRAGQNNNLAARLDLANRSVFVKGVPNTGRPAMFLSNEAASATRAPGIAPAVHCTVEADGWLVVVFDYLDGRPANLAPGSPDLGLVGVTVDKMATLAGQDARPLRLRWRATDWWEIVAGTAPAMVDGWDIAEMTRLAAELPELVDGGTLAHTDLHGDQFIINADGEANVIDWAFPGVGAPWIDSAFVTLRLIEAGHTPAEAEAWAVERPAWASADAHAITVWSVYIAGLWSSWAASANPAAGAVRRAQVARDYAAWRLQSTS